MAPSHQACLLMVSSKSAGLRAMHQGGNDEHCSAVDFSQFFVELRLPLMTHPLHNFSFLRLFPVVELHKHQLFPRCAEKDR